MNLKDFSDCFPARRVLMPIISPTYVYVLCYYILSIVYLKIYFRKISIGVDTNNNYKICCCREIKIIYE